MTARRDVAAASGEVVAVADGHPDAVALAVVRGEPAPDELAALVAVLAARRAAYAPAPDGYAAWRVGRLAALRSPRPDGPSIPPERFRRDTRARAPGWARPERRV